MSLLLAYTFNDNNVSSFADFSGNKQTGSGTLTSIVAGQNYGYAANFGATNNYITVTPTNFSGISAITVFTSLYLNSLPTSPGYWYIINQSGSFNVQINYSGNVVFSVFNPGLSSYVTVTSATAISATTWTTIGCVWDGSTLYTYINGIQDANTAACTSATTNNNAVYIGNDTSADSVHTFNGKIDNIEVRSEASIEADMINLTLSPGGMEIKNVFHNFSTGDLIADDSVTQQAVVTWVVDTANFYCYPLSNFAGTYKKIGNIYQSSRQYFTQLSQDFNGNGDGQMKIMFPITGFADYISPANTYTYDKNGYEGLATLVAGSTAATATAGDNSEIPFVSQGVTEDNKKPDFLFPNIEAYNNPKFNSDKLVMLASKTTCKDRWRQILNEADRIETKHLFTLQQGISKNQLDEMYKYKVCLVVPQTYLGSFPKEFRSKILTLEQFVSRVQAI